MSKGGVLSLTRAMASELTPYRIRVNAQRGQRLIAVASSRKKFGTSGLSLRSFEGKQ